MQHDWSDWYPVNAPQFWPQTGWEFQEDGRAYQNIGDWRLGYDSNDNSRFWRNMLNGKRYRAWPNERYTIPRVQREEGERWKWVTDFADELREGELDRRWAGSPRRMPRI